MIATLLREIAAQHGLTVASGMAYGMLGGCFVTLSQDAGVQRISIYVGPQEQPVPGYGESQTVSCARQICAAISTASGSDNLYCLMTGNEAIPALVLNHAGSVVTVNFPDAPEARSGIERFVAELLPQIAPLTRPQQCILCCGLTEGKACPVRLSRDTVVPMHDGCCQKVVDYHAPSKAERIAQTRAILGAALGAVIAVIPAIFLGHITIVWTIAAVLMGLLPVLAYDLLKGKSGAARIAMMTCSAIAVVLGSCGLLLLSAHHEWSAHFDLMKENAIGFVAYTKALFGFAGSGMKALLLRSLMVGFIGAGVGCGIGWFLRLGKADVTGAADKPRRLKGKF